jgi:hypothetical protein
MLIEIQKRHEEREKNKILKLKAEQRELENQYIIKISKSIFNFQK